MTRGQRAAGAALAVALLVAACGSDTTRLETGRQASQELRGVFKRLIGKTQPAPVVDAQSIALAGMAVNSGPSVLATLEMTHSTSFFALRGENGAMRTWIAPSEQALITRNGMLAGSRGFGHDMMSAEVGALGALVHARAAGTARIELRYLDGVGKERPLPMDCTTTAGAAKAESFAGLSYAGTQMRAHCEGHGFVFDADYLVTAAGEIVASRQWVGPQLGYIALRSLQR